MTNLSELPAAEMAAQLGHPTGVVGVAVGHYMNGINGNLIEATYRHLAPPPDAHILEIGFGNGKFIAGLLGMAPGARYAGVDVSETMVSEALKNNDAFIET